MNIDIEQLLESCGIDAIPIEAIPYSSYVPNLYDLRVAREHQAMLPTDGSLPPTWGEECSPTEAWYMGYVYAHALGEIKYAQQLMGALGYMLGADTVPVGVIPIVLLVIKGLEYQYKPEDITWYESRLRDISTKLCAYYQPATTKEGAPHAAHYTEGASTTNQHTHGDNRYEDHKVQ